MSRGPAPKDPGQRVRRNKEPERVTVAADGVRRGPDLPVLEDDDGVFVWPAPTLAWWDNWRLSAQATVMGPTDWDYLLETALLHARFWGGEVGVAAELRLRVAKFGATPEDRLRLKMSIGDPVAKEPKKRPAARGNLRVVDGQAS